MDARCLKSIMAKRACAVGERKRHDNEITPLNLPNVCADLFDHTYRFVPHHATSVAAFHFLIWPEIAPANARARNANDSISRLDDFRVGHVLDPNVASTIHDSCFHNPFPFCFSCNSQLTVTSPEPSAAASPAVSFMRPSRV